MQAEPGMSLRFFIFGKHRKQSAKVKRRPRRQSRQPV
jgi:hypothetical protein